MFSLTQKSMVKKPVRFQDQLVSKATVFPMFRSEGKVEALVILDHAQGRVYGVPWSKGLVSKPWFRPLQIARKFANLEELSVEKAYKLTQYWHYDIWWLLNESPFQQQPTTPPLRETNCVNHLEGITSVHFARDLSKVDFWMQPAGESLTIVSPADEPLPPRTESEAPLEVLRREHERGGGWRLKPFWERQAG